jgi:hypothetical protein
MITVMIQKLSQINSNSNQNKLINCLNKLNIKNSTSATFSIAMATTIKIRAIKI